MDMGQGAETQPSPIEGLPVELVRMLLSHLPDAASLQAAALSCPLFFYAFLKAEETITTQVLLNQIDISVLPEAMVATESSLLRPHDPEPEGREAILEFVSRNLRQRPSSPRYWSLRDALDLSRLHFYVDWLAEQLSKQLLSKKPLDQTSPVPTRQERCRIERALYRFEIYCNLFRETPSTKPILFCESPDVQSRVYGEQKTLFFANFSPWENEQLGCIHDFLVRAVSPAFDDIAEHEIAWGVFCVDYGEQLDSPYIQHLLSTGLEKIFKAARAETYEERYELLYSPDGPSATDLFLHENLRGANERNNDIFLDTFTPEDEANFIKRPFFTDPDPGPEVVWRWAHQEETRANWIYQENRRNLRQWGYVIWDRSRLEETGIFQEPWEDRSRSSEALLEEQEAIRQRAYMQNSWEARQQISRSGGTGWWSWGDHSKIQWEGGAAPGQRPPRQTPSVAEYAKPGSLQEAREMLSMMKLPPSAK